MLISGQVVSGRFNIDEVAMAAGESLEVNRVNLDRYRVLECEALPVDGLTFDCGHGFPGL